VFSLQPLKGNSLHKNMPYDMSTHCFAQLTLLPKPPNPMLYNGFESARHSLKCMYPWRHLHPHLIHLPWAHLIQHPKLHLNRFSHFAQLMAESPYT